MAYVITIKPKGRKETVVKRRRKNTALIRGADEFLAEALGKTNGDAKGLIEAARVMLSGEFESKANGLSVKIVREDDEAE